MKNKIKIIFSFVLIFSAFFSIFVNADFYNNQITDLKAKSYLMVSADTNQIIFSKNTTEKMPCGSMTKMVTSLVVADSVKDFEQKITVKQEQIDDIIVEDGYRFGLVDGEQFSVKDLLYLVLLDYANDAAQTLAANLSGSVDKFVEKMNSYVASLGCKNTKFVDPTGISSKSYSTAEDLIILEKKFAENSFLSKIASTESYQLPATNKAEAKKIYTTNYLVDSSMKYYYKYAKGIISSYDSSTGYGALEYATKDGYTYYAVVLGCNAYDYDGCGENDEAAYFEIRNMLRWAFNHLEMTVIADTDTFITEAQVSLSSKTDHVRLVPSKQIMALLLDSVDKSSLVYDCTVNENIKAPIKKGDVLGKAKVKYADVVLTEIDLVAGEDVKQNLVLGMTELTKKIISSPIFIVFLIVAVIVAVVLIIRSRKKHKDDFYEQQKKRREMNKK